MLPPVSEPSELVRVGLATELASAEGQAVELPVIEPVLAESVLLEQVEVEEERPLPLAAVVGLLAEPSALS